MSSYPLLNVQNGRIWDISANNVTLASLNGNGPAGYILVSAGTTVAPTWSATLPASATPTLASVLTVGNKASTFLDMSGNNISNGGTFTATTFKGDLSGNITGGLGGQLLYQSAVNTTAKLANGSAGQVLQSNGTTLAPSWATATGGATIKKVRKSTDQSTSSTTLVDDSQLLFAVAANETYIFQLWLFIDTTPISGAPDINLTCVGPSGSTVLWSSSQVILLPDAAVTATTVQTSGATQSLFADSNLRAIQLYGTILNGGTAGNLQFRFAQNTAAANPITVKAGSYIFGILV